MNFNQCQLGGHTTRDPELRYTPNGVCIANFGLAINRTWKDETGNKKEECNFFDVVAFGRTAEVMGQYVKKGDPIFISGRLRQESWTDKASGAKRYAVKIIVESFQFLNRKSGRSAPAARGEEPQGDAPETDAVSPQPSDDDQIPF